MSNPASAIPQPDAAQEELLLASRSIGGGLRQADISVPDMHCGGCMRKIETALGALDAVESARANLSSRRVSVRWRDGAAPPPLVATLHGLGFAAHLHDAAADAKDPVLSELVRALAVSGFAASNIMLLSVSVWSGAEGGTRDLFHWISAFIALPALLYAGRVFFRSAFAALRRGRTNMDVPISIGVVLAFGMSLYDTATHGHHAYFDAATSLLFFLLIGRTLDHMMRERARTAVTGLQRLIARGAHAVRDDGSRIYVPLKDIVPGMLLRLAAGERVPVDGVIETGESDLDCSLVNGESAPRPVAAGAAVRAGTLNLTAPLAMRVTAAASDSFLAETIRLMEAAESGRSGYRRIADRVSAMYAPVVHLTAFLSFLGWMAATGDWHRSITIAVAVLIVTCPCALGLAVPMVQVVAARRLFEAGVMVKDGSALERIAETDCVVFDKTGTLTLGQVRLADAARLDRERLALAASLAVHSLHPHSRALAAAATPSVSFEDIREVPGLGLEGRHDGHVYRLGRAEWALDDAAGAEGTVLARDGRLLQAFHFEDELRPGAREMIAALLKAGLEVEILSGDTAEAVRTVADELGIARFRAGVLPADKVARLAELAASGRRPLMVGDGLNDAPALAAAHASMAPGSAADIGRNAADIVFLRDDLRAVLLARDTARSAGRLVRQNFGLAVLYNVVAVPLAVFGFVTPLIAALAMSGSSILVVANAMRLAWRGPRGRSAEVQGAARLEAKTA